MGTISIPAPRLFQTPVVGLSLKEAAGDAERTNVSPSFSMRETPTIDVDLRHRGLGRFQEGILERFGNFGRIALVQEASKRRFFLPELTFLSGFNTIL